MNNKIYKLNTCLICILIGTLLWSCEDFVEVDAPRNEIIRETAITDDESAVAAISGIYSEFESNGSFTNSDLDRLMGLYSDELLASPNSETELEYFQSNLTVENGHSDIFWSSSFNSLLNINSLLEILEDNNQVTQELKNQIEGEAKFLRAFSHFYLTNLFGRSPIITSSDVVTNNTISRSDEQMVYQQIILDLEDAIGLMAADFSFIEGKRIRPNRDAAIALLARTYLYIEDWEKAEEQATLLINNNLYTLETDLNDVFLAANDEAIWQIEPSQISTNFTVLQANRFVIQQTAIGLGSRSVFRNELINSFEVGDRRFTDWVGSFNDPGTGINYYFPYKYKNVTNNIVRDQEYLSVFRLAEQYLIRAEARAKQGNIIGAQSDVNSIRNRAGLANTTANTQVDLLMAVEQERKVELFTEFAHRWLDIKRTGKADAVLSPIKTDSWRSTNTLLPISLSEIEINPNLLPQNQGY
ncbi:RagB/SusD family nutrient uptake outer membrane protein [Flavivirga amylovorans]|uniref:RagB/SusD family nutrient uptake outer membrane protein n=1 Tax=Flavivirga amylovorans TaxID=870486 RepID=A0ABT8X0R8_9FLAO|nr:RagB/SusD family nutrient uptake outer membrane protein [Flavivirga amylovorans]MDO5987544.1 RagB/SusD family nutrient uptake outer membrane protein [Flavivirga amylovorans]